MKDYEVLEINKKSFFKTTIYFMIIPTLLLFIVGLGMVVIGLIINETFMVVMGIPYLIMPVILILIYGLVGMLVALVYNKLAKRFGGLELKIVEKNPPVEANYLP
ncbi:MULTISPECIES: hypothetical protein [Paenibacillus]|uniref:hypothetical protein n=1 Tax=Paenibacillus TaxID=44249 RepID=UPI00096C979F|nr:hypothetical protein [Paenibacillus odorifer]OME42857.1 hypothetical protein BSK58_12000 [Paenibacillus odorifer]